LEELKMRKVLLSSAAICGLALAASPAMAEEGGVKLDLGGYFMGYGSFLDQDTGSTYTGTEEERDLDLLRQTEIHFTGETTLDNGLTVGAHFEMEADGNYSEAATDMEESYMYLSGGWGRLNLGEEDGTAFLLQVSAPSGDSVYDGIRQLFSPMDYTLAFASGAALWVPSTAEGRIFNDFDYDQDIDVRSTKITYLTPVMNGFQGGLTYIPDSEAGTRTGNALDDETDDYGEGYEIAARYEGQMNELGFILGAGYSRLNLEDDDVAANREIFGTNVENDDRDAWNVGVDMDYGPFGLGVTYMEDNLGYDDEVEEDVWVVGLDYTTGPFKLGASWLNQDNEAGPSNGEIETDRYTGGVVYTYGPGMTFRGNISYIEHDMPTSAPNSGDDVEATSIMLGTMVKF
jgi:predicted porin